MSHASQYLNELDTSCLEDGDNVGSGVLKLL